MRFPDTGYGDVRLSVVYVGKKTDQCISFVTLYNFSQLIILLRKRGIY